MNENPNGELINISYPPSKDNLSGVKWRTRDGEIIPLSLIKDNHLRNIALFLMGMGYQKCIASSKQRVTWLTVMRMEWERRQLNNTKLWRASINEMSTRNQE